MKLQLNPHVGVIKLMLLETDFDERFELELTDDPAWVVYKH